ncbi:MAG TPA: outer membrane beta-barrel protein [Terriglobales bacterium]|nr:outer membrane beta-barrel protein [Terriglobales bacterium]
MRLKTERKTQLQLLFIPQFGLVIVLASFCFLSLQALAQNDQQGTMTSSRLGNSTQAASNPGSASNATDAEILQELDRMRARIQELESRLKQRSGEEVAKDSVQPSSTATSQVLSSSISASQGVAEQKGAADSESGSTKTPKAEPFAFADWTWLNGNPRTKEPAFDSKFFTPEIRADVAYHYDFNHPKDDTIGGSSEVFRSNEVGLTHLGVGGDFHYDHVRARVLSQIGLYSTATPRNDASTARGQWDLANAYRYVNEAYGGYHFDALHGINVDAGIFLSYVGLFSFYNFDNWAYQPSYVSSNTPWFFTGMRIQVFPTEKLKIEPWIINGWQSYGRFNGRLGFGGQVLYRPTGWLEILSNNYGAGADALGIPTRTRYHTDNSIEVKYYDHPERFLDKMAFSLTGDAGCESGGGVNCTGNRKNAQGQVVAFKQSFLGFMLYNRWWFHKDRYGFTLGGGKINNPGRYLVLLPPINGATAASGTPYFTENPGDPFKAWDMSATYDYMPSQYITFRWEFNHRHANVPYWSGPGGITPPGGNTGAPGSIVPGFQPDLRHTEDRATMAILVKF